MRIQCRMFSVLLFGLAALVFICELPAGSCVTSVVQNRQVVTHAAVQQHVVTHAAVQAAPVYAATPTVHVPVLAQYAAVPLLVPTYVASYGQQPAIPVAGQAPASPATPAAAPQVPAVTQADLEKLKKEIRDEFRADLNAGFQQIIETLQRQKTPQPAVDKQ